MITLSCPIKGMKLGGLKRKLDLRDIKLGRIQAPMSIPDTYLTDLTNYPSYFQNGFPTCGAHAGAFLKTIQETQELKQVQNLSPRFIWDKVKLIDNLPLETGTDMRSLFKTLQSDGVCDYSLLPNDYTITLEQYSSSLNITQPIMDNAQPRIIGAYAFTDNPSLDQIKQAIYQNKTILLLLHNFGNGFFGSDTPKADSGDYGHFVCAFGYSPTSILVKDSTETAFPKKELGLNWLPYIMEMGTCLDLDDATIKAQVQRLAWLQKLVVLWRQVIALYKSLKVAKT